MDRDIDLRITTRALDGHTAVAVHGELDLATASVLRRGLLDILHHEEADVVIDLSGVRFCDATGLAVLVATERRARLLGGTLRLVAPQDQVARVLRVTNLDRHFRIYSSIAAGCKLVDRIGPGFCPDPSAQSAPQQPEHETATRAWEHVHAAEIREAVGAVLAETDAWHAADPGRWLTGTLGDLATAYGNTDSATLTRAARALLTALTRHPVTPSAPVVESATRLRRLLDSGRRQAVP